MLPRDKSGEKVITKFLLFTMFPLGVAMILDRLISEPAYSGRMARHLGIFSDSLCLWHSVVLVSLHFMGNAKSHSFKSIKSVSISVSFSEKEET